MHYKHGFIFFQPVRRSGALRAASRHRSQRRWLGGRSEAGRGALLRPRLTHLLSRRRRFRQSRHLRLPPRRGRQLRHSPAREPCPARTDRPSADASGADDRPPNELRTRLSTIISCDDALLCELQLSGWKLDDSFVRVVAKVDVAIRASCMSPCRVHRHQHGSGRGECRRLLQ